MKNPETYLENLRHVSEDAVALERRTRDLVGRRRTQRRNLSAAISADLRELGDRFGRLSASVGELAGEGDAELARAIAEAKKNGVEIP